MVAVPSAALSPDYESAELHRNNGRKLSLDAIQ